MNETSVAMSLYSNELAHRTECLLKLLKNEKDFFGNNQQNQALLAVCLFFTN